MKRVEKKMLAASRFRMGTESIVNPSIYSKAYTGGSDPFKPMKMINLRNKIAHGQKEVNISEKQINEFSTLIENLMDDVAVRLREALDHGTYLTS